MKSIYAKGRDNARTPMQWNDSEFGGFTTSSPWIKINSNYTKINANEQLSREDSVFGYYKELINLRKRLDIICFGDYELLLPEHNQIFAYQRSYKNEHLKVVCNFTGETAAYDVAQDKDYEMLLCNYSNEIDSNSLKPFEARVYWISSK